MFYATNIPFVKYLAIFIVANILWFTVGTQ